MDNYIKVAPAGESYTRPSDWLPIPSYGVNEEVFYGLHPVYENSSNQIALLCTGTGSGYSVDWGDGTTTTHSFNTKAERDISWANVSSSTLCSRGYRQTIVKITPQSGATITGINLSQIFTGFNFVSDTRWLDIVVNFATQNTVSFLTNNSQRYPGYLELIKIKAYTPTNAEYLFLGARSLRKIELFDTSHVTNARNFFNGCWNLQEIPNFNFSNVTNAENMFKGTVNLTKVTPNDFKKVTNGSGMFWDSAVRYLSNVQFRDLTNMYLMFYPAGLVVNYPDFSLCTAITGNVDYSLYPQNVDTIPQIALGGVTTAGNLLYAMPARRIIKSLITGFKFTHSYINQLLSATELNNIFTNLGTANSGASITITGNPGAATCNQSIATAKGWTVIN